jgi:hypothetical protein
MESCRKPTVLVNSSTFSPAAGPAGAAGEFMVITSSALANAISSLVNACLMRAS